METKKEALADVDEMLACPDHRLTTREAAAVLGRSRHSKDTICLLRGAGVPSERCGSSYLWDARAVERLARALGTE